MLKYLHKYANPVRFLNVALPIRKAMGLFSFFVILAGLLFALFFSPPDYQQKETVRIMYIHVPAAWMSLMIYAFISFSSIVFLVWKFPLFLILAKESVTVGVIFTFSALFTGSLWGKPTWGTYWVWDARLTSFLILFFIYLGLKLIKESFSHSSKGDYAFAYLALIGGFNLPIIKFSVDWWNTLHQPASINLMSDSTIHVSMLFPLILMTAAFALFSLLIFLMKYNTELIKIKNKGLDRL